MHDENEGRRLNAHEPARRCEAVKKALQNLAAKVGLVISLDENVSSAV